MGCLATASWLKPIFNILIFISLETKPGNIKNNPCCSSSSAKKEGQRWLISGDRTPLVFWGAFVFASTIHFEQTSAPIQVLHFPCVRPWELFCSWWFSSFPSSDDTSVFCFQKSKPKFCTFLQQKKSSEGEIGVHVCIPCWAASSCLSPTPQKRPGGPMALTALKHKAPIRGSYEKRAWQN